MLRGSTVPLPIINCIGAAREPSLRELCAVADHIRTDLGGPAMSHLPERTAKLLSLRAAHAALIGSVLA